jgi:hypothetical protein
MEMEFATTTADMSTQSAETMIEYFVNWIGQLLQSGLVSVLGLVAVLIGLFFVYYFVKRQIGRGK